jgi:hypothetical protein
VIVRIIRDGEGESFGGYVALDTAGLVLEKSDTYGVYEQEADDFEGDGDECTLATRSEFSEAWNGPYATRSRWRRLLANLNGASDADGDPSEQDSPTG